MPERIKGKTLVARDEGDDANGVLIKLYGEETNGAISIIEQPFEPGFLLPPHLHENDVWLYVLEGEMHARVGDEVVKATPGCWVLKPRRIPHTIWNAGPEPARIIELYTPGGFELFFKDFGNRLRQGPIGLDKLNHLGEPHGILESEGASLANIVYWSIAVVDGHAFDEGVAAFQQAWNPADPPPAITVHVVAGLAPGLVEIDAVAVV